MALLSHLLNALIALQPVKACTPGSNLHNCGLCFSMTFSLWDKTPFVSDSSIKKNLLLYPLSKSQQKAKHI